MKEKGRGGREAEKGEGNRGSEGERGMERGREGEEIRERGRRERGRRGREGAPALKSKGGVLDRRQLKEIAHTQHLQYITGELHAGNGCFNATINGRCDFSTSTPSQRRCKI